MNDFLITVSVCHFFVITMRKVSFFCDIYYAPNAFQLISVPPLLPLSPSYHTSSSSFPHPTLINAQNITPS